MNYVVVADGDPTVRSALQAHLQKSGYGALTAANVEVLVALLLATTTPLVVLLDDQLPGLMGLETLLRADDPGRRRAYILLAQESGQPPAELDGAIPVVDKPFSEEVLLEAIARAVDRLGSDRADQTG